MGGAGVCLSSGVIYKRTTEVIFRQRKLVIAAFSEFFCITPSQKKPTNGNNLLFMFVY